jgi:acyl-homoserine-lactone acylase
MLLANPHFPWGGPLRFYQVQLTVPGRLDVTGAALFGMPVVAIGHNQHAAWTHTVDTGQRFTLYQLQLTPGSPTTYVFDGQAIPMTQRTVAVDTLAPDGTIVRQTHTYYGTRFGPVLANPPAGLTWTADHAFAYRDANADNIRMVDQWLAFDAATSVAQIQRDEERIAGVPWVNTIAADDRGSALYMDLAVVPHVTNDQLQDCVNTPLARQLLAARLTLLDGTRAACDWGTDADSFEPGLFGPSHLPREERRDFVENSNDSHWLPNPRAPLTGFPLVIGTEQTQRSLRTRLELIELSAGTAGGGRFTLDELLGNGFDDRSYAGELARDDSVSMCEAMPPVTMPDGTVVDVSPACPALRGWDLHMDLGSRGGPLFEAFMVNALAVPGGPWLHPFSAADPLHTPSGLNAGDPRVQQALAAAVVALRRLGIPLDAAPGDVQFRATPAGERIPLHGGVADAMGIANDMEGAGGAFAPILTGSTFVMAVELTRHGPRAKTLMTYSQSSDTASPFAFDQTRLFSQRQWLVDRYTLADILADPALRVTVLVSR